MRRLALVGALLMSAGCDLFGNPPVKCEPTTFAVDEKRTVGLRGCEFPAEYLFTIARAPRVDPTRSTATDAALIGGRVTVTQGNPAILICASVDEECLEGTPQITTTIRGDGALAYQGFYALDNIPKLGGGDTFTAKGTLVTETYGPGNSCDVALDLKLNCEKAQ